MPKVRALLKRFTKAQLIAKLDGSGLPFAPIGKPEELFDDPHLAASGGLVPVTLPGGEGTRLPALPIEMDGQRFNTRGDLPDIGEHSRAVLADLGLSESDIERLVGEGAVQAA
jgi:crotonobetainyl-CoA:carnitine CoA-transferase CaiB-like acyl-CoA transferase